MDIENIQDANPLEEMQNALNSMGAAICKLENAKCGKLNLYQAYRIGSLVRKLNLDIQKMDQYLNILESSNE